MVLSHDTLHKNIKGTRRVMPAEATKRHNGSKELQEESQVFTLHENCSEMGNLWSKSPKNRHEDSEKLWRVPNPCCAAEYRARSYHDAVRCPYCIQAAAYAVPEEKSMDSSETESPERYRLAFRNKCVTFDGYQPTSA